MAEIHFISSPKTFQDTNFSIIQMLADVTEGNTRPAVAVIRLRNIGAPDWMVRGLLALDAATESEPPFGFTLGWCGEAAADLDALCGTPTEESQGSC